MCVVNIVDCSNFPGAAKIMFALIIYLLAVPIGLINLIRNKNSERAKRLESFIVVMIFFQAGVGGLFGFVGHVFRPDQTAAYIGWPAGSPFQFEIGMANLMIGVLGILSIWFRGEFWLAATIGQSIFYLGCAVGHILQQLNGDMAPGNTGILLYFGDIFAPLSVFALVLLHRHLSRTHSRSNHRTDTQQP